jgi:hypothetical protein
VPEKAKKVDAVPVSGRGENGHPGVAIAACARCGKPFIRHRKGHLYCSRRCRRRGVLRRPATVDHEAITRLFHPDRDPAERVREDDWFPEHLDSGVRDLYACDTVAARRRWFEALDDSGQI